MKRKITAFFSLSSGQRLMMVEAYLFLAWARFVKLLPFSKTAPRLGTAMLETSHESKLQHEAIARMVSRSVRTMSKYTFWESQCLVKAIAAMKMLERRGIESTLYLGTAKDHNGKMVAHAWLRSGPGYVTGYEEMRRFTVVAIFGKTVAGKDGSRNEQHTGVRKEAT